MPRRALRKLHAEIDLSGNYHELTELTKPLDFATLFAKSVAGPNAPVEIEIGSGKGLFLLGATQRQPDTNFLGNELAHKYALHAANRLARAGRSNGVMVHGDGLRMK